jgi:hypothetical protein
MTPGETIVFSLILAAFVAFTAVLGWVSRDSRRPRLGREGGRVAGHRPAAPRAQRTSSASGIAPDLRSTSRP